MTRFVGTFSFVSGQIITLLIGYAFLESKSDYLTGNREIKFDCNMLVYHLVQEKDFK